MDPRHLYADERLSNYCVYCGNLPCTADHVPSKVFLDEPYPENLPVVQACKKCNDGFSKDESYLACLIECALTGSVESTLIHREKIKQILVEQPRLASRIQYSRHVDESGDIYWEAEINRVKNIILKLARGHVFYELSEQLLDKPKVIWFSPVCMLSKEQMGSFESPQVPNIYPEIGSRMFSRILLAEDLALFDNRWRVVQPGRYRYLVSWSGSIIVRFVIREYLACEVNWD
ncbi:MAG: hypothetical protein NTW14_09915 [bacterium]|nr:hypothetical protein [bacterium]